MKRGGRWLVLLALVALSALIDAGPLRAAPADCRGLAAEAERHYAIPTGILQSMAMVESGIGGVAWPWTINAGGNPLLLRSREEALQVGNAALHKFGDMVAVGCMQIHLHYHGHAFGNLAQVLEPTNNVAYAARLLVSLRATHGSWVSAVEHYNASNAEARTVYLCQVLRKRASLGFQAATPGVCQRCGAQMPGCAPP